MRIVTENNQTPLGEVSKSSWQSIYTLSFPLSFFPISALFHQLHLACSRLSSLKNHISLPPFIQNGIPLPGRPGCGWISALEAQDHFDDRNGSPARNSLSSWQKNKTVSLRLLSFYAPHRVIFYKKHCDLKKESWWGWT